MSRALCRRLGNVVIYLLLRMTCTDGGEDNSPVHATYLEDQVTLGSDLLDL